MEDVINYNIPRKGQRAERKYAASDPDLERNPKIKGYFDKWAAIEPPKRAPKWPLDVEEWTILMNEYSYEDKESFLEQLNNGFKLTSNDNIQCKQGQKSYKLTEKEWEFVCKQIDEYTQSNQNCVWGAFHPLDLLNRSEFIGHIIMPHFVAHRVREDGSEKLRIVTDATHAMDGGMSFNDNIFEEEKNVSYINIIDIISMIVRFSLIWMVVADAVNAFNRVPIDRNFVKYFGIQVGSFVFFWTCLVFGGASSCNIYTWFASMIVWILVHWNQDIFMIDGQVILKHYLDDFITGHRSYAMAWCQYYTLLIWFKLLGIPTQEKKMIIPSRVFKYIGYIINTLRYILMMPLDKIAKIIVIGRSIVAKIDNKEKLEVLELQSFVGVARFATPVFYYIIPSLRNIEEVYRGKDPKDKVWGNQDIKKDIMSLINVFLETGRNYITFKWLLYDKSKGDIVIETDASGTIGMGGYEKRDDGASYKIRYEDIPGWDPQNQPDIVFKELWALWIMHKLCKKDWEEKAITFNCDNKAVVSMMIKKRSCFERKDCQDLIRDICECSMVSFYYHWYHWISTKQNKFADALSRFKWKIINEIPFKVINKDKEAILIAAEGLKLYKAARKRMIRSTGDQKLCKCKNKELCEDQPLYNKWFV